jgi:transcription-repair coupling factor (superfamily II helicase)
VLIPETYVPDLHVRLALYRRLSDAEKAEDREALAAELIDRFGPLPEEADQLLKVVGIKGLCREANVVKIDVGPKGAVVGFRGDHFANPAGLVAYVQKHAVTWRLRPDQKVVIKGEWETPHDRLGAAERILRVLDAVAKGVKDPPAWAAPPAPKPSPAQPPHRTPAQARKVFRRGR